MSIYGDIILDHYHNPRNQGTLECPTCSVDLNNPLCGDKIHMEVQEENGVLTDVAFTGQGCAISMASASMITEFAKGKTKEEILNLKSDAVLELLGITLTPNRLKCALLSLEALQKALTQT